KSKPLPLREIEFSVGSAFRQLALKMCIAFAQLMMPNNDILDPQFREYLKDKNSQLRPVRDIYMRYPLLDERRPALAHTIYIEGNSVKANCFGIVQIFGGIFQFYVLLSDSYVGRDFGAIGILDISTFREKFEEIGSLKLEEAPASVKLDDMMQTYAEWDTS